MLLAQAALNYATAEGAASDLREALLPVTFFLAFAGYFEAASRMRSHGQSMMHYWVTLACIVILTAGYPSALTTLRNGIDGLVDAHTEKTTNLFSQILEAELNEQPSAWTDLGNYVLWGMVKILQALGRVGLKIVELLQNVSMLLLVAISPICLGMLATSWTKGAGTRFVLTSVIVAIWGLGEALVDILLFALGEYMFGAAVAGGGAAGIGTLSAGAGLGLALSTMAVPSLLMAVTMAAVVPIALYLSIPVILGAIFLGSNPLTASLSTAAGMAGAGMGIAGATAARSISAAAGMSRAAAASRSGSANGEGGSSAPIAPPAPSIAPPPSSNGGGGASAPASPYASAAFDASTASAREGFTPSSGGATASGSVGASFAPSGGVRSFAPASGGASASASIPGPIVKPANKPPEPPKSAT